MIAIVLSAVVAYAATNIDDILLLTVLLAGASEKRNKTAIVIGQYLGIFLLFAVSIIGALGARILPTEYVGLLGIVPILLGLRALIFFEKDEESGRKKENIGIFGMALLAVANGADNLGVYIPLFSGFEIFDFIITAAVFAIMTGVWCALGCFIGAVPPVQEKIGKYKRILVPLVLIVLGVWILIENYLF